MVAQDPANQRARQSLRAGQVRGGGSRLEPGGDGGRGRAERAEEARGRASVREMGGCSVVSRVTGLPRPSRPLCAIPVYPRNNQLWLRLRTQTDRSSPVSNHPPSHRARARADGRTRAGSWLGPLDFPPRLMMRGARLDWITGIIGSSQSVPPPLVSLPCSLSPLPSPVIESHRMHRRLVVSPIGASRVCRKKASRHASHV